jgi:hypothetical protein
MDFLLGWCHDQRKPPLLSLLLIQYLPKLANSLLALCFGIFERKDSGV